MSQVCARCGTINKDESQFCLYCGAPLPLRPTEPPRPAAPSPPRPTPPTPRPTPAPRARTPDFVGLFGVAFFLLVIGVVFYLNQNLLSEIRRYWDQILAGRIAFRPPEGLIISAAWFWGLLGISSFGIAFLRWTFARSRIRTFGAFLDGIGMVAFAFFLYRYSLRTLSGSLVISLEAAVLAALLFIYIGSGLYWTSARRRALVAAAYRAPRP